MAHYALLDENNVVTQVITGKDEGTDGVDWEQFYGNFHGQTCKRTSYNTFGNTHLLGGTPFRKNGASVGYTYDASKDAFIPPNPHTGWVLNNTTCLWEAPVDYPGGSEGDGKNYYWNDSTEAWTLVDDGG